MIGSPFPIYGGASTRTLWRRVSYGGKKGRAATRRLRALERRLAPLADAMLAETHAHLMAQLEPVMRFARGTGLVRFGGSNWVGGYH